METNTPKYQKLVQWLKEQIHEGAFKPGDKLFSENKLCEMFGISRQTVRQAIGILESEGYLERHRGSGTYVTQNTNAARAKTMNIGVITTYVDDYIFPPIIRGIGKVLSKNGYSMQLSFTLNRVENETKALQDMMSRQVDGIIVEPTKSGLPNPNIEVYRQIARQDVPLVFINAYYQELQGLPFPHVALDDRAAGKTATRSLIKAGHRDIAAFFQSDDLQGHLRYAGYLEALIESGIRMNARRVVWFATEDITSLFDDETRIRERMDGATAVVCYNDQIASRLTVFLKQQGVRVPEDISVVSVDNASLAEHTTPPLSSINHPKEILGQMAAENLLKRINNPGFDANHEFEAKLVERSSIKKLE